MTAVNIHCCSCKKPIDVGPEYIPEGDEGRQDLAVRCVYCLRLLCVPCALKHFEARNGGRIEKRVIEKVNTVTTTEWRKVPASAWAAEEKGEAK
jgi:hypothetical protein